NTHELLDPVVGRCDREDKCGYHLTPKQYFEGLPTNTRACAGDEFTYTIKKEEPKHLPELIIDPAIMKNSLKGYNHNCFTTYLIALFGRTIALGLISKY